MEKWDRSPEAFDTYANLLHRTNKSHEAIQWEEKALSLKKDAPDEKIYTKPSKNEIRPPNLASK